MALTSNPKFSSERHESLVDICTKLLGAPPDQIEFPGGISREAYLVHAGGQEVIVTRRESVADAELEAFILKELSPIGLVPGLKAQHDEWIVQCKLPGTRLPLALDGCSSVLQQEKLMRIALDGLLAIHDHGRSKNLAEQVPELGVVPGWLHSRIKVPLRISAQLGISPPEFDRQWLHDRLCVDKHEFVKWDARPGNCMLHEGRAAWFDWEDCGRGFALDDLGFVLFDEWQPLDDGATQGLIRDYIGAFNSQLGTMEAEDYLMLFGFVHCLLRLRMAVKFRVRDGHWWPREKSLWGDKVGVTPSETHRLINRTRSVAQKFRNLSDFERWLDQIEALFEISSKSEILAA